MLGRLSRHAVETEGGAAVDLRQLECFLAVCEELHFSRAAEKLNISQPSLSRHIRNLEAAVGMPLFDRIGRRTALTEAGRILQAHALRMFHELDQAQAAIRDLGGLQRGRLTVGALHTTGYLLPPAVAVFKGAYPNIELSIHGLRARDIADKLLENAMDLGITSLPPEEDDLEAIPLFDESLALAVAADHELAKESALPLRALADVDTILLPETYGLRCLLDECCTEVGVTLKPVLEMSSLDALVRMVADGVGATVLPASYIESLHDARIAKVGLVNPTPRRPIGLLYRAGKFMCATTRTFIELLTGIAAEFDGGSGADPTADPDPTAASGPAADPGLAAGSSPAADPSLAAASSPAGDPSPAADPETPDSDPVPPAAPGSAAADSPTAPSATADPNPIPASGSAADPGTTGAELIPAADSAPTGTATSAPDPAPTGTAGPAPDPPAPDRAAG